MLIHGSKVVWAAVVLYLCCLTVFAITPGAQAKCVVPPPAVLWSYPADGDREVPTNADFWIVSNSWSPLKATLDGQPLTLEAMARASARIAPPALEPDHDYLLRIELHSAGLPTVVELRFRTGTSDAASSPAPVVTALARDERALPADPQPCQAVLQAQACFDTGWPELLSVEVDAAVGAEEPIAWLIEGEKPNEDQVWPASCGTPKLRISDGSRSNVPREPRCLEIGAITKGGLSAATRKCEAAFALTDDAGAVDAAAPSATSSEGCSLHSLPAIRSKSSALCLFATFGLLSLRRRLRGV